jgi:hypothetical protein
MAAHTLQRAGSAASNSAGFRLEVAWADSTAPLRAPVVPRGRRRTAEPLHPISRLVINRGTDAGADARAPVDSDRSAGSSVLPCTGDDPRSAPLSSALLGTPSALERTNAGRQRWCSRVLGRQVPPSQNSQRHLLEGLATRTPCSAELVLGLNEFCSSRKTTFRNPLAQKSPAAALFPDAVRAFIVRPLAASESTEGCSPWITRS